ncbi:MAG: hypothetical protein AABN95_13295 [Acidobacteriota bacterium]
MLVEMLRDTDGERFVEIFQAHYFRGNFYPEMTEIVDTSTI